MNRFRAFAALLAGTLAAWCSAAGTAAAQPAYGPRSAPAYAPSPPVSPYLNLLRRGSSPAVNYYGLVRPQIEFRDSIQGLQQQVSALGAETANLNASASELPFTGHPVQFMNSSHYFPARGGLGSASRAPATGIPPRQPAASRPPGPR